MLKAEPLQRGSVAEPISLLESMNQISAVVLYVQRPYFPIIKRDMEAPIQRLKRGREHMSFNWSFIPKKYSQICKGILLQQGIKAEATLGTWSIKRVHWSILKEYFNQNFIKAEQPHWNFHLPLYSEIAFLWKSCLCLKYAIHSTDVLLK